MSISYARIYALCNYLNLGWKNRYDSFKIYKEGASFFQNVLRVFRGSEMGGVGIWRPCRGITLRYRSDNLIFFFFFLRFYLLFLERGEGREKGERDLNVWLPFAHPQLGTWPAAQACALTGNLTGDLSIHRPVLNPLNHTSQAGSAPGPQQWGPSHCPCAGLRHLLLFANLRDGDQLLHFLVDEVGCPLNFLRAIWLL